MEKVEFICSLSTKSIRGGETIKNDILYEYLKSKKRVRLSNFKKNKIVIFLNILKSLIFPDTKKIILSKSAFSAYFFLWIADKINFYEKEIYYFVIGGRLDEIICEKKQNLNIYKKLKKIYVETNKLKENLEQMGLENVQVIPNFKRYSKRIFNEKEYGIPLKTIFFSRITSKKGVDMIFDMLELLNKDKERIKIDFYGPISNEYQKKFRKKILANELAEYKGILNGQDESIYEILEQYDLMLFPTFWEGEGFPGTIIDSYIASLPIVASNWKFNSEIIKDKETGFLFEAKNQNSFNDIILKILKDPNQLKIMRKNCYRESEKYNIDKVLEKIF